MASPATAMTLCPHNVPNSLLPQEEEIFLFDDEDIPSNNSNASKELNRISLELELDIPRLRISGDEDDESSRKFPVSQRKTVESGHILKRFQFGGCGYSISPARADFDVYASSCDSEYSASMTIEGLRDHLQSCFTCGVLWRENQASLDCHECDGYALTRPCPECDGTCPAVWTRDLTITHQNRKAKWVGSCRNIPPHPSQRRPN